MIAETRGKEAFELVESISSGHPMITTIHSDSSLLSLERILKMFQKELDFNEEKMLSEMATHIRIGIHIEKQVINRAYFSFSRFQFLLLILSLSSLLY